MLITALAALAIAPRFATVEITPTDDVWAYPHASDQDTDAYLRVWGFEGQSVAKSAEDSESFGYAFLKFDLAGLPEKALKGAELVVTHVAKPAFSVEMAVKAPLEVRPSKTGFTEKSWTYSDLAKVLPPAGDAAVYGTGSPNSVSDEKDFAFKVDLSKGAGGFLRAFEEARKSGQIGLALTTRLSPNEEARSVYKLYSRNGPKENRPTLRLTFED